MSLRFCDRCGGRLDDICSDRDTGAGPDAGAGPARTRTTGPDAGAGPARTRTTGPDAGAGSAGTRTTDPDAGADPDAGTARGAGTGAGTHPATGDAHPADAADHGHTAAPPVGTGPARTRTTGHDQCQAARRFEPPRYCARCGRRMVVQVSPDAWTARCAEHGTTSHLG
jgi:hypothetical protein